MSQNIPLQDYNGNSLCPTNFEFLKELEDILNEPIPRVSEIKYDTFGFIEKDAQIIALGLYDKKLSKIPDKIGNLSQLKRLGLQSNKLTGLPEEFSKLLKLEILNLNDNLFSQFPQILESLTQLISLGLEENHLSTIPNWINKLENLEEFRIRSNFLKEIPESISQLNRLKYLDVSNNFIDLLPENITNLSNLEVFLARNNLISSLPNSPGQLTKLKILKIENNVIQSIPECFKQIIKEKTKLDLNDFIESFKKDFTFELEYIKTTETFLEELLTPSIIKPVVPTEDFFLFLRQWNSYYPSFYDIDGGCYVICVDSKYTIIDPGYKTLKVLREKNIDTRLIKNIIITHNHGDHIGGILELLELNFKTSQDSPCHLYVNPGMLTTFEHYSSKALEIVEINPNVDFFVQLSSNLAFKSYIVPHLGIGMKQKSIAIKFRYTKENQENYFVISSDLDGNPNYLPYYIQIFNDAAFIILHLGTMKFNTDKKNIQKDKHLYIDGIYSLISNLSNVNAFFIQEFGLEMASPEHLAIELSKILFNSGYYFPYIILTSGISNIKNGKDRSILIENLFPNLISDFFKYITDELTLSKEYQFYPNYTPFLEFCNMLCIDFLNLSASNNEIKIYNIWDNQEIPYEEANYSKFLIIFDDFKEFAYFGIRDDIDDIYKNLNIICKEIIPKSLLPSNFFENIENNALKIIDICGNVNPTLFESIFSADLMNFNKINPDIPNIGYPQSDFNHFPIKYDNQNYFLRYIPWLVFVNEYHQSRIGKKPNIKKNQDATNKLTDIRKELISYVKEKAEKNVFLGEYGKKIDFSIFSSIKNRCSNGHLISNRDKWMNFQFSNDIYCEICERNKQIEYLKENEQQQIDYEMNEEIRNQEQEEIIIDAHKWEEDEKEEIKRLIDAQKYEVALKKLKTNNQFIFDYKEVDLVKIIDHQETPFFSDVLFDLIGKTKISISNGSTLISWLNTYYIDKLSKEKANFGDLIKKIISIVNCIENNTEEFMDFITTNIQNIIINFNASIKSESNFDSTEKTIILNLRELYINLNSKLRYIFREMIYIYFDFPKSENQYDFLIKMFTFTYYDSIRRFGIDNEQYLINIYKEKGKKIKKGIEFLNYQTRLFN